MSFWQEFMLRILWLLGVKGDFVEKIVIEAVAGQLPQITITRAFASEGEVRQIVDVFTKSPARKLLDSSAERKRRPPCF